MATPKIAEDSVTDLDEAVLNKYLNAIKAEVKVNYCVVRFVADGNAVTVDSSRDSDGEIVDGDLSWNAGSTVINIVLSGFENTPCAFLTMDVNGSTNVEKLRIVTLSAAMAQLYFLSNATPGTAVDPDGDMYVHLLVIGY